ncbi:hypothetical protein I4U23_015339 [Adineta vaga]|nr:hypothetical protein I4U23_015339 [Adineta vaga]
MADMNDDTTADTDTITSDSDLDSSSHASTVEESDSDADDKDEYDLSCDDRFEQLYKGLFQSFQRSTSDLSNDKIQFDFNSSSRSSLSSESLYLDEIESFFNDDDTSLSTLTSAIMITEENANLFEPPIQNNKIFVGSIPKNTTEYSLKLFFNQLGYTHITDIHGPIYTEDQRIPGYAFVFFDSDAKAAEILTDYSMKSRIFKLNGHPLRLTKANARVSKKQSYPTNESHIHTFSLTSLMYGTLIGTAAMQNIIDQSTRNERKTISTYGYIIHQILNRLLVSSTLNIDTKARKFSIDISLRQNTAEQRCIQAKYRFEWNFCDLKRSKIMPVVTHGLSLSYQNPTIDSIDPSIFFLCEIRRAPYISYVKQTVDGTDNLEIRLPGLILVGRANAWLFRIKSEASIYKEFVDLLHKYRLCEKHIQGSNIIHLLKSANDDSQRLTHIDTLSMNEWNQKHREAIIEFKLNRWPSFPFETKFELMKLISKHIITINDLILDERLESILSKMSQNTLIVCVDKIIEFSHLWQPTSEDPIEENWNDESNPNIETNAEDSVTNTYQLLKPLHSATGMRIDSVSSSTITVEINGLNLRKLHSSTVGYFGSLSRLICLALDELNRTYQLCQTETGAYVTRQEMRQSQSNELSFIRKIFITPTSIHYEGPHPEQYCAVTRQFANVQHCFLRVSFRDEDYRKLKNGSKSMIVIYKHILKILNNGLTICGRKYEFLAFSSSQLREHSCWMFSSENINHVSCDEIRESLGNFQNIHPVAKMAARLGQSFSTTTKGKQLSEGSYTVISDAESPDPYKALYTDGIGIIKLEFAKELSEQMKLDFIPSAFQVRCGGYKGMVCVDIADKLKDNPKVNVAFRLSMEKFESKNVSFDIVRVSSFSLSYLNRQMILLLSSRDVPDCVFHSLQNRMIDEVMSITNDVRLACNTLEKFNKKTGGNGTHNLLIGFLSRFGLTNERFIQQILLCFQAFQLKRLRTKAQILIENGCMLYGVVDETSTLKYQKVFIQVDRGENDKPKIIQGPVIVCRHPCLHPGDIRCYEAVDNPLLHSLKNVIVFPMDGPKSMTAELAGGDLDGDTFWISWEPQLLFSENYPALCYDNQTYRTNNANDDRSNQTYGIVDICRFFVEYIEADNLGVIANWHMALADLHGVEDKRCLTLAEMHSIAVDFVKTGRRSKFLSKELRPLRFPDFMEKRDKPEYISPSILGQLYREAKKYTINLNPNQNSTYKSFPYSSLLVDGYSFYINDAKMLKQEYDHELRRIMRHYGIYREGEIISGYILKFMSKQYAKEGKIFELSNEIAHVIRTMRNRYIQEFWEEFYLVPSSIEEHQEENNRLWREVGPKLTWQNQLEQADFHKKHTIQVEQKASAWFYITYKKRRKHKKSVTNQREQFYSFAWLIYPVLFNIYENHRNETVDDIEKGNGRRRKKKQKRRRRQKNRRGH